MSKIDFHIALSERHKQILDLFVQKEEFGNRTRVIERALEVFETVSGDDIEKFVEISRARNRLIETFDMTLIGTFLIDELGKVAIGKERFERFLEKIKEVAMVRAKMDVKFLGLKRDNSFGNMTKVLKIYSDHLNQLSEIQINEEERTILARLKVFNSIPQIPLEKLNAVLEALGFTFDIELEKDVHNILLLTWTPSEQYPRIKEKKEKYLESKRRELFTSLNQK